MAEAARARPAVRVARTTAAAPTGAPDTPLTLAHTPGSGELAVLRDEVARLNASVDSLQTQNDVLRRAVTIYDRLGRLVLEGAETATITAVLSDLIQSRVLLLDTLLQPLSEAQPQPQPQRGSPAPTGRWAPNEAYVSRVLGMATGERRPLRVPAMPDWGVERACVLAPIVVGDATLGFLGILEDDQQGEEVDLLAVQHAATVYALALMRQQVASEMADRLRGELLDSLLLGQVPDEHGAALRAERLGFDASRTYRVVSFTPAESEAPSAPARPAAWQQTRQKRVLDGIADVLLQRAPDAITSVHSDEVVALIPGEPNDGPDAAAVADQLGRAAARYLAAFHPSWSVTVGVGGTVVDAASGIARSYQQASRAVETACRFGRRGEVLHFERLGLYRLLFHVQDAAELRAFVEQTIGPLIAYDRAHQADFVRTLARYLENHESLQATARELSVHVNTVTYRIQRIQSITGLNLEAAEDRLLAHVALKILDGTQTA